MAMEKAKALEMALSQIEKDFGKGAIMRLGDAASKISVSTIPSGCLELDFALGVGGIPRGRIIEIYGPESSGKTTIALHIIAEAQKLGGTAAFIDAEHALDPVYAENLGVDVDELYVSQPDTGEDALEICETLVRSGAMDVVVIDSARSQSGDRGRHGGQPRWPSGKAYEPSPQENDRHYFKVQYHIGIHKPAARKGWRNVW